MATALRLARREPMKLSWLTGPQERSVYVELGTMILSVKQNDYIQSILLPLQCARNTYNFSEQKLLT